MQSILANFFIKLLRNVTTVKKETIISIRDMSLPETETKSFNIKQQKKARLDVKYFYNELNNYHKIMEL